MFLSRGIFSRKDGSPQQVNIAELEESLIAADAGAQVAAAIAAQLKEESPPPAEVRARLESILENRLLRLEAALPSSRAKPFVVMLAGVNGSGKTTTIAKMCRMFALDNKKVLLAAGDTFRAAAREQLQEWALKLGGVEVLDGGAHKPSAAAFDAVSAGVSRGVDIVLIDTAGRLPTQPHLMAELLKIKKAATKAMPGAPHEMLLVLDGSTGQNAINQARAFSEGAGVTGFAITKLDGTSRGGFLLSLAESLPKPVRFIGTGESADDLIPFDAKTYARELLG